MVDKQKRKKWQKTEAFRETHLGVHRLDTQNRRRRPSAHSDIGAGCLTCDKRIEKSDCLFR